MSVDSPPVDAVATSPSSALTDNPLNGATPPTAANTFNILTDAGDRLLSDAGFFILTDKST